MDQSYAAVEKRIKDAIDAINTRKNAKHSVIAREFHVPYDRLRNRLTGASSRSEVRGLYHRLLTPDKLTS